MSITKFKFLLLAIVFLGAIGCEQQQECSLLSWSGGLPVPINIQTEIDADVVEAWNESLGIQVFVDDPSGVSINYISKEDFEENFEPKYVGWTEREPGDDCGTVAAEIFIKTPENPNASQVGALYHTVAHELGHVLGMGHEEEDQESIMYPNLRTDIPLEDRIACPSVIEMMNERYDCFRED